MRPDDRSRPNRSAVAGTVIVGVAAVCAVYWFVAGPEPDAAAPQADLSYVAPDRPSDDVAQDAAARMAAIVGDLNTVFLDAPSGDAPAPTAAVMGQSPAEAAATLADRYDLGADAEAAVASRAEFLAEIHAMGESGETPAFRVSTTRLDDVLVHRQDDGWVVDANVYQAHPMDEGGPFEEVAPWTLGVDPVTGEIGDLGLVPDGNG